jgi:FMN hydrolase / 5-amino-6-(5-phospho-D-ribitylamino)uracil phosphatase
MRRPQVISLDLDDTLWPIAPVIEAAEREMHAWLEEHYPRMVANHTLQTMRRLRNEVLTQHPERSHDLTFIRKRALQLQARAAQCSDEAVEGAFDILFAARNRVTPFEDCVPALKNLSRHFRLFAVSNGNADLNLCGVASFFDGHITARAAGAAKPDPRIFAELLAAAKVAAEQIVHVGDDPHADVDGAARAGLGACWLNRAGRAWPQELAPPHAVIASLAELTELLRVKT